MEHSMSYSTCTTSIRPPMSDDFMRMLLVHAQQLICEHRFNQAEKALRFVIQNAKYRLDVEPKRMPHPLDAKALETIAQAHWLLAKIYVEQRKYPEAKSYLITLANQNYHPKTRDQARTLIQDLVARAGKYEAALGLMNLDQEVEYSKK